MALLTKGFLALAIAAPLGLALPASAAEPAPPGWQHFEPAALQLVDGRDRRGYGPRHHGRPPHGYYGPPPRYYAPPPRFYAPPPVYLAPPPVYYYPPRPRYYYPPPPPGVGLYFRF